VGKFGMLFNNMRILLIASAAFVLASLAVAQPQYGLNLMPMQSFVQAGSTAWRERTTLLRFAPLRKSSSR
jgi:hypothetical protein